MGFREQVIDRAQKWNEGACRQAKTALLWRRLRRHLRRLRPADRIRGTFPIGFFETACVRTSARLGPVLHSTVFFFCHHQERCGCQLLRGGPVMVAGETTTKGSMHVQHIMLSQVWTRHAEQVRYLRKVLRWNSL
jgi:hypothetical protein